MPVADYHLLILHHPLWPAFIQSLWSARFVVMPDALPNSRSRSTLWKELHNVVQFRSITSADSNRNNVRWVLVTKPLLHFMVEKICNYCYLRNLGHASIFFSFFLITFSITSVTHPILTRFEYFLYHWNRTLNPQAYVLSGSQHPAKITKLGNLYQLAYNARCWCKRAGRVLIFCAEDLYSYPKTQG
jgi:hypothetical protein